MKHKILNPFLFVALMVLMVSLACNFLTGKATEPAVPPAPVVQPTSAPLQQPPQQQPTQPSLQLPTQQVVQPTAVPPTVPPAPPVSQFFKEEFTSNVLGDWTNFISIGDSKSDKKKAKLAVENGKLIFTLEDNYLYSYLIYDKQTYDDVSVEVSADNRGKNNNNISLICRYSDAGWYEFNVLSSGLWNIQAFDATGAVHKGYNLINSGGSNAIRIGKATNVYVAVCSGNTLKLYINGEESASMSENKYGFSDGKVGVSVSSFNVYPIIVELEYFDIQKP
jgi:hypothetical protein